MGKNLIELSERILSKMDSDSVYDFFTNVLRLAAQYRQTNPECPVFIVPTTSRCNVLFKLCQKTLLNCLQVPTARRPTPWLAADLTLLKTLAFSKNDFGACRFEGAALRDGHAGEHWLEKRNSRQYKYIAIFYPSSQLCSCCCYHNTETEDLALQEWTCHKCDRRQDRDINTAKNILQEGLRLLASV